MARYGEVPTDNPILADIKAKREGLYEFRLYPKLWSCPDLAAYYKRRKWEVVPFTSPPPALPVSSGIYMFVVGPYCGDLKDHSRSEERRVGKECRSPPATHHEK